MGYLINVKPLLRLSLCLPGQWKTLYKYFTFLKDLLQAIKCLGLNQKDAVGLQEIVKYFYCTKPSCSFESWKRKCVIKFTL